MTRKGQIIDINGNVHSIRMNYEDLTRADLSGADLTGANLSGAYLREAHYVGSAIFTGAKYNSETRFPKVFNPGEKGMIQVD